MNKLINNLILIIMFCVLTGCGGDSDIQDLSAGGGVAASDNSTWNNSTWDNSTWE